MILYLYNKCSTCQDALRFLQRMKASEAVSVKEITQTPPSMQELLTMLDFQNGNLKKLFNVSGNLYRELHLNEKLQDMSQHDALLLLTQHGMLVKRPFLLAKDFGLLGFKEGQWVEKFQS